MAIARTALGTELPVPDPALAAMYRETLLDLVARAEQRLVRDARKLTAEAIRARRLIREMVPLLEAADGKAAEWIAQEIPRAYLRGVRTAELGLREIGLPSIRKLDTAIHREAIQALVDSTRDEMAGVTAQMQRGMQTLVRRTQLAPGLDKMLTKTIARGVGAGKARREVSSELARQLLDEYKDGAVLINGKRYAVDSYAELLARTMTGDAQRAGTINRMVEAGQDLVMVTAHGADDECSYFEGKGFSISGTHPKYPPLSQLPNGGPPFHPNCKHGLAPFVESFASGAEKRRAGGVPKAALGKTYSQLDKMAKGRK